ncbi:MAG: DUF3634 family protein [Planctomycetes bacterium]|nr:DUF3634 family protein [Planctomycetota bacterium]
MEALSSIIGIALAGLIIGALWKASRPPCLFVIRIESGAPRVAHGKVTGALLERIREAVAAFGIWRGRIAGRAHGQRIRLDFSREFPPAACQQLRNWWTVSGWSAGKRCD